MPDGKSPKGVDDLVVRPYRPSDEDALVRLWTQCGLVVAWNDPRRDIARKLRVQPELFLVAESGGEIVASVMAGYEGHRGWINYLAVAPERRLGGLGRRMMAEAETRLLDLGCPKINLQVRSTNPAVVEFYEHLGFTRDESVSLGKRLVPDD